MARENSFTHLWLQEGTGLGPAGPRVPAVGNGLEPPKQTLPDRNHNNSHQSRIATTGLARVAFSDCHSTVKNAIVNATNPASPKIVHDSGIR